MNHIAANAAIERVRISTCGQSIPRFHNEMALHLRGYVARRPNPNVEQYIELLLPVLEMAKARGPIWLYSAIGDCIDGIRESDELRREEEDEPYADEKYELRRDQRDMETST